MTANIYPDTKSPDILGFAYPKINYSRLSGDLKTPQLTEQLTNICRPKRSVTKIHERHCAWWSLTWVHINDQVTHYPLIVSEIHYFTLCFALSGKISVQLPGIGESLLDEERYTLFYIPPHTNVFAKMLTTECELLCISISMNLIDGVINEDDEIFNLNVANEDNPLNIRQYRVLRIGLSEKQVLSDLKKTKLEGNDQTLFLTGRICDMILEYRLASEKAVQRKNLNGNYHESLNNIKKYIEKNIHLPLTIAELSRSAGMNIKYFEMEFKRLFTVTPKVYIEQVRLKEAARLLEHTDTPIGNIAHQIGISASNYFATVFKKNFNCTPREYRNLRRKLI